MKAINATLCFCAVLVLSSAGQASTPNYWNCFNQVSGAWAIGTVPMGCDVDPFASPGPLRERYAPLIFNHNTSSLTNERHRYGQAMFTSLRDAANHYLLRRNPGASTAEQQAWRRAVMSVAMQESFWTHYRDTGDGKLKMLRGDFGHGHGMFQVDDRFWQNELLQGKGAVWSRHFNLAMDIYYNEWQRAATAWCVSQSSQYWRDRTRSAWSAYNGGPAQLCRWTDPNHPWAHNDNNFLTTYTAQDWLHVVSDPQAPAPLDIPCLLNEGSHCGGGSPGHDGKYWVSTWADANGRDAPGGTITGTLYAGTHYVYCKAQGPNIQLNGLNNHWWLKTDLDTGQYNQWISAALLNNSSDHQARDNNGNRIPQCDLLPHGAIGERYNELGNNAGLLGAPVQPEADAQQGGRYQRFENGIILWHPDTGAQPIHGQILAHFEATGVEGHWGFPVTAEADAAPSPKTGNPGRYQYFEHAHGPRLLLWTATTGAFGLHGAIHDHFANNGRETVFGYPTGDEQPHGSGVKQEFELYTFYWTPQQGVWTTSK